MGKSAVFKEDGKDVFSESRLANPDLRINSLIAENENVKDVTYSNLGLRKEKTKDATTGKVIKKEYYNDVNEVVVRQDIVDTSRMDGYLENRETTHTWVKADGTDGLSKVTNKKFTYAEASYDAEKNRKKTTDEVKMDVLLNIVSSLVCSMVMSEGYGGQFLMSLDTEMGYYVKGIKQPLRDAIAAADVATFTWLDDVVDGKTIRQRMIDSLV